MLEFSLQASCYSPIQSEAGLWRGELLYPPGFDASPLVFLIVLSARTNNFRRLRLWSVFLPQEHYMTPTGDRTCTARSRDHQNACFGIYLFCWKKVKHVLVLLRVRSSRRGNVKWPWLEWVLHSPKRSSKYVIRPTLTRKSRIEVKRALI